jgi:hypothetical protein
MLSLYRGLLYLYPSVYRREYADEMVCVFRDAEADARDGSVKERIAFRIRETFGLLAGAARERVRSVTGNYLSISFRRFDMHRGFRFPRSTVFLMTIIFAGVILIMEKANTIQMTYASGVDSIWPSLPWFLGIAFSLTCAVTVAVWGIRFKLGRTGAQRLANLQAGSKAD